MKYGISMQYEKMAENDKALDLFSEMVPEVAAIAASNPMSAKLSLEQLIRYIKKEDAPAVLERLDAALRTLNTPENRISPSEARQIAYFKELDAQAKRKPALPETHRQDAIYPGQVWLDTKGERIQAHGAAMFYENGIYYWYGENKEYTDGKNGIWTWGLRFYSSTDLCNWKDLGLIVPPILDDPESSLYPAKRLDRPHILRNEKTGDYVMWVKLSGAEAGFTVLKARHLLGPYEVTENLYNPGGNKIGDFDLVKDEQSGKAYLFCDCNHAATVGMLLTEDYCRVEREVSRQYENLIPPFVREAASHFVYEGKHYLFTSGMTGYIPNRSDCAMSDSLEEPFRSLGNPHVDDVSLASFNSQISYVFPVQGSNLLIAMADRWVPDYKMDARRVDLFERTIASHYAPDCYKASEDEQREMHAAPSLDTANTSKAGYVWLPVLFEDGMPKIRWIDSWKPEDYIK